MTAQEGLIMSLQRASLHASAFATGCVAQHKQAGGQRCMASLRGVAGRGVHAVVVEGVVVAVAEPEQR